MQISEQIEKEGFYIIRNYIKDNDLEELITNIQEIVTKKIGEYQHDRDFMEVFKQTTEHYVNPHTTQDYFNEIQHRFGLHRLASEIINDDVSLWSSLILRSAPNTTQGQSWHQDLDPTIFPNTAFNFLIYPYGTNSRIGNLRIVRGSHKMGQIPRGEPFGDLPNQEELNINPGDLVIMNCGLFHMVTQNQSESERIALNYRFKLAKIDESKLTVGVYRTGSYDFGKNKVVKFE